MNLQELATYKNITILCHNIPDADTIGSGFALQQYFLSLGAEARLIYGGWEQITKPNLLMLLESLQIEIFYTKELPSETELLIAVDCQYGAGNVQKYDLPPGLPVSAIDHHKAEIPESGHAIIRPQLGSCATLVWDLLRGSGYDVEGNYRVSNALFYGLYTDTNGLGELRHPLDRDLSEIVYDAGLIRKMKNSAITPEELDVVGDMLKTRETERSIALFRAHPCDPNLLGFASDIAQQTAGFDCCVMYSEQLHGMKLSIRSSAREIMANEIAAFLCRDVGGGGGNIEKAGGFLDAKLIEEKAAGETPEEYLRRRVREYLTNYDYVYPGKTAVDFEAMPLYRKLPLRVGFVRSADIFPAKTKITVRTLEGDIDTVSDDEIYLMVGVRGEVYPIKRETFEKSYETLDEAFEGKAEYTPAVMNRATGEKHLILPYARTCVPRGEKLIRAAELQRDTKVFSDWDMEKYFYGVRGDYLAANNGSYDDCYIIQREIFFESYERA